MKKKLFFFSVICIILFTYFSYTVAREKWQQYDFDTTVKLQDHISRRFDNIFSYFSYFGSAEVTVGLCLIFSLLFFIRGKWLGGLGWLIIVPATAAEVFGKLVIYHPGPPVFLHRSLLPSSLPSFYVHTDFSYPSGHMTRTIFIITILICMAFYVIKDRFIKFILLGVSVVFALIMGLTRVYLGEHWFSDVIGGTLLGMAAGFFAALMILGKKKLETN